MPSPQYISQQSYDLDIYLPNELSSDDYLSFQTADKLLETFNFDLISSGHRMDMDPFDPINDDQEAISSINDVHMITISESQEIFHYLCEQSTVVPHISKESMGIEEKTKGSFDIKKFLVFDSITGRERRPLLFEFLRLLLEDNQYSDIIEYIDRKQGIFKLHKPKAIAQLWKHAKGRNSDNRKFNFNSS